MASGDKINTHIFTKCIYINTVSQCIIENKNMFYQRNNDQKNPVKTKKKSATKSISVFETKHNE